jgi:acyl carrier protein
MTVGDRRLAILDRLQGIVRTVLARPDILLSEQTTASDVRGWDSLAHLHIILSVENEFGLTISARDAARLEDAGSLVTLIATRGKL